jgi:uncharacterized integral membrane protein
VVTGSARSFRASHRPLAQEGLAGARNRRHGHGAARARDAAPTDGHREAEMDNEPGKAPEAAKKGGLRPGHVVLIVAAVLVVVAVVQNFEKAQVSFLAWDLNVWLWLIVVISAALGFAIGWFAHVQKARAARKKK